MTAGSADSRAGSRWESVLDSVVVYAQGALCRRLARGTVPQGGRIRVTGLPRTADHGSLRARVLAPGGLRVAEARVEVEAAPAVPEASDELRRAAERLTEEHGAALRRRDRQLRRIEEIAALRPAPPSARRGDPPRLTPVNAWLELADFVDDRLTGLHARLAELEEALRSAEHDLEVATDRLSRASSAVAPAHVATTVCAVLVIDGAAGGEEAEVELEYGVPGAVWAPAYRLTHRTAGGDGQLLMRASVAQCTGEDWSGVRVGLATADLSRRSVPPELRSVRIGRTQAEPQVSGWREPPAGLAELFAGYDSAGRRPAAPSRPAAAAAASAIAAPASGGYGAAPSTAGGSGPPPGQLPPPAQPTGAPAPRRARTGAGAAVAPPAPAAFGAPPAPGAPAAPGAAPAPPPPEPTVGPPHPDESELDYLGLVLSGPQDPGSRRGRLFPAGSPDPVTTAERGRAEAVAGLPLPHRAVRPRESAGSFDHRYDCAARADIPSDGTWHTVTVGEVPVGLRSEFLCVPSVEQTVYATLVLSNATEQALLAGPLEVASDDGNLLTTSLPSLAPGGERRVGLGPAEGVRVTRRVTLRESTSGLRGTTTVLDHRIHVELANRLGTSAVVEVRERVPLSGEADVRVEERAGWAEPEAGAGPDVHVPGTRVWRTELAAGTTTALEGGYEIRIPAGKALTGGNRRS